MSVEATEILAGLTQQRMVLVSGKGGVGKTVVSALIGQAAARQGRRVLIVESAATAQVAPLFGAEPPGHHEVQIADNLWTINLNPDDTFREYVVTHLGQPGLFQRILSRGVVRSFLAAIPGLAELMVLGRLYYASTRRQPEPFDLVVFDGPAFGHFASLLSTPQAVFDAGLGGPVLDVAAKLRSFLLADDVCAVLVARPEGLVVSETVEFFEMLRSRGQVQIEAVFLNRLRQRGNGMQKAAYGVVDAYRERLAGQEARALDTLAKTMTLAGFTRLVGLADRGGLEEPVTSLAEELVVPLPAGLLDGDQESPAEVGEGEMS